jgi:hypothetical protein
VRGDSAAAKVVAVTKAARKNQSINALQIGSAMPEGNRRSPGKADSAKRVAIIE